MDRIFKQLFVESDVVDINDVALFVFMVMLMFIVSLSCHNKTKASVIGCLHDPANVQQLAGVF